MSIVDDLVEQKKAFTRKVEESKALPITGGPAQPNGAQPSGAQAIAAQPSVGPPNTAQTATGQPAAA